MADVTKVLDEFEYFFAVEKQQREQRLSELEQKQQQLQQLAEIANQREAAEAQQQMAKQQQLHDQMLSIIQHHERQPAMDPAFLHDKVVQLARALAKMTRERDRLDVELARATQQVHNLQRRNGAHKQAADDVNMASYAQVEIWRREVNSLRAAIENHVAADRHDRRHAQHDKETVLNEVAEELGQVMAQRDLAFVELEKLRRIQQHSTLSTSSASPSPSAYHHGGAASSVELDSAEKQIAALQLQLAHARRDVTLQSVNLHITKERYVSLRCDVEKACRAIQTTSEHCARATTLLHEQQSNLAMRGSCTLSAAQVAELLLFVSRSKSDLSNISTMLTEMRGGNNSPPRDAQQLQLT